MITLAFDTCLDKMYAVLKKDGKVLASRVVENHDNKYHSAYLISTLREIMTENGIKPQDIDLIATNIGPGSFTGIRACVTVARVMAQQLNCKAVGISSLEILAHTCPPLEGEPKSTISRRGVLVALDARKNSAYLYKDGEIKGAIPLDEIKTEGYTVLTDDKLQPILGGTSYQKINLPLGETLADLAESLFLRHCGQTKCDPQSQNRKNYAMPDQVRHDEFNKYGDWRKLKPLYIQPPPAM